MKVTSILSVMDGIKAGMGYPPAAEAGGDVVEVLLLAADPHLLPLGPEPTRRVRRRRRHQHPPCPARPDDTRVTQLRGRRGSRQK